MYLVLGCAEGSSRKEEESMREEKGVRGHAQVLLEVKNPPANAGDTRDKGSIPGLGRSSSWTWKTSFFILVNY